MYKKHQLFSNRELESLVNEFDSFVILKNSIVKVLLAPSYLGNEREGLWSALAKKLKAYDPSLEGIPLGFKKVRVDLSTGRFYGKNAEIQYPVQCECYVFQPVVGERLSGTVKQISPDHVSCIVHQYFNVTIKRPEDEPYDVWNNRPINFNDNLSFIVRDLDYTGRIPYIEGALEDSYVPLESKNIEEVSFDDDFENYYKNLETDERKVTEKGPSSESGVEDVKFNKGRKRKRQRSSGDEGEDEISVASSTQLPMPNSDKYSDSGLDFDFLSPIRGQASLTSSKVAPKKKPALGKDESPIRQESSRSSTSVPPKKKQASNKNLSTIREQSSRSQTSVSPKKKPVLNEDESPIWGQASLTSTSVPPKKKQASNKDLSTIKEQELSSRSSTSVSPKKKPILSEDESQIRGQASLTSKIVTLKKKPALSKDLSTIREQSSRSSTSVSPKKKPILSEDESSVSGQASLTSASGPPKKKQALSKEDKASEKLRLKLLKEQMKWLKESDDDGFPGTKKKSSSATPRNKKSGNITDSSTASSRENKASNIKTKTVTSSSKKMDPKSPKAKRKKLEI